MTCFTSGQIWIPELVLDMLQSTFAVPPWLLGSWRVSTARHVVFGACSQRFLFRSRVHGLRRKDSMKICFGITRKDHSRIISPHNCGLTCLMKMGFASLIAASENCFNFFTVIQSLVGGFPIPPEVGVVKSTAFPIFEGLSIARIAGSTACLRVPAVSIQEAVLHQFQLFPLAHAVKVQTILLSQVRVIWPLVH